MRELLAKGKQADDILDLTAPAEAGNGIVARWLRRSLSISTPEPAWLLARRPESAA